MSPKFKMPRIIHDARYVIEETSPLPVILEFHTERRQVLYDFILIRPSYDQLQQGDIDTAMLIFGYIRIFCNPVLEFCVMDVFIDDVWIAELDELRKLRLIVQSVALQPLPHPILLVVHVIYDNFPILPIDIDIVGGSAKEICNFLSRNVHVIIFFKQVDQLFESHDTIQMQ